MDHLSSKELFSGQCQSGLFKLTQSILRIHNKEALRIEAKSDQKHYKATSEAGGLSFLVFLTTSQYYFCQITE